jgi:hypothetical protein
VKEETEKTDKTTFEKTNEVKEETEKTDETTFEKTDEVKVELCTYEVEKPEYTFFPSCDSSYNSLVDALKSIGAQFDSSYRATIAELNGITDYKFTAEQNMELLDKLKAGTLIKSKEIKIETKTIPCEKETTSKTNEVSFNTNEITSNTNEIAYKTNEVTFNTESPTIITSTFISSTPIENEKDLKVLLTSLLISVEGNEGCKPYNDTRGYPTIGIGKLCEKTFVKTKQQMYSKCASLKNECEKDEKIVFK